MTFSIVARCPDTGMLGVAISTAIPAVGALCPAAAAGVGAVASQAWVNPQLRTDALSALRAGTEAQAAIEMLLAHDPAREERQIGIVAADGAVAAYTGVECVPWKGHILGDGYALQGNMLVGGETLTAMEQRWHDDVGTHLAERLVRCLEVAQAAGGDRRGKQSAALLVVDRAEFPLVDLRADEHLEPVGELRRLWNLAQVQLLPFVQLLPTRDHPAGGKDDAVTEMIMLPPRDRPTG